MSNTYNSEYDSIIGKIKEQKNNWDKKIFLSGFNKFIIISGVIIFALFVVLCVQAIRGYQNSKVIDGDMVMSAAALLISAITVLISARTTKEYFLIYKLNAKVDLEKFITGFQKKMVNEETRKDCNIEIKDIDVIEQSREVYLKIRYYAG